MLAAILLSLALAGPAQAVEPATPEAPAAEAPEAARQFDVLAQVADGRRLRVPGRYIDLPPEGSWMIGPLDVTPTKHVVLVWITGLLTILLFLWGGQDAKRRRSGAAPRGGHNALEAVVLYFRDKVVISNIGPEGRAYVPYITAVFFFILIANLLGLIPYGGAATSNIAVTATLAFLSLLLIEGSGMRVLGPRGYLGTVFYWNRDLALPVRVILMLIMAPVEFIGKLAKPFALAVRLMANMFAGSLVIYSLIGLIFVFGSIWIAVGPVAITVALTFLKIFVAFLQAYIFALLTAVFIGLIRHAH